MRYGKIDKIGDKYQIRQIGDNNFMVSFDGRDIGTIRQRTSEEVMDLLNENRRKLYRKNPELYPGDITQHQVGDYYYNIPIITAFTKKNGGKLNARLVKRKN